MCCTPDFVASGIWLAFPLRLAFLETEHKLRSQIHILKLVSNYTRQLTYGLDPTQYVSTKILYQIILKKNHDYKFNTNITGATLLVATCKSALLYNRHARVFFNVVAYSNSRAIRCDHIEFTGMQGNTTHRIGISSRYTSLLEENVWIRRTLKINICFDERRWFLKYLAHSSDVEYINCIKAYIINYYNFARFITRFAFMYLFSEYLLFCRVGVVEVVRKWLFNFKFRSL